MLKYSTLILALCSLYIRSEARVANQVGLDSDSRKPVIPKPGPVVTSRYCYAQNDPHMRNFDGTYFEFQYLGTYCMYNSGLVKVEAEFQKCNPATSSPTCNCRVRVTLSSGKYLEVNTCSGGPINQATFQPTPSVPPATFGASTLVNTNFIIQNTGLYYSIKTSLGALLVNDNIEVRVFPGWVVMSRIEVIPSYNYQINGQQKKDCCLCGRYRQKVTTDDPTEICRKELFLGAQNFMAEIVDDEGRQDLNELLDSCVKDFQAQTSPDCDSDTNIQVGVFQKQVLNAKVIQGLQRALGIKELSTDYQKVTDYLRKICDIQKKKYDESVVFSLTGRSKLASANFCL